MRIPVILLLILSAGVRAQDPTRPVPEAQEPAAQEKPEVPAKQEKVSTVIVTARKWEEEAQDVPSGLSVLVEEVLRDAGIKSVRDASYLVPNLFLQEFSSRRLSFPTMRGIGSGQGDPAVTTYIGGVPQLTTSSTNVPLFDVERVEFLRGPQATLYGRNALGGVIHVVPRRPSNQFRFSADATIGNFDFQEYRVSASGPIVEDKLLVSGAFLRSVRDGYTENDFTDNDVDDRDSYFGRAELLWLPDDQWEVRLAAYGERSRDGGFVLGSLASLRSRPHHINQDFEGKAERDIFAPSLTVTFTGEKVEVTSISAFQDWDILETADFDFSPIDGVRRKTKEDQTYFNQEFRVSSAEGAEIELGDEVTLRWLLGVNVFLADSSRSAANDFRPAGAGILFPPMQVGLDDSKGDFDDWGLAIFGQATVSFAEKVDLGVGLRFDHEDKEADLRRTFVTGGFIASDVQTSLDDDYDEFVPEFSLAWHATEDVMPYARVAKGFKAGGFNLAAPTGSLAFGPETSWSWELGVKTSWLDDRLRVNAAGFWIDWDDMQLTLFDAMSGGYVSNAGEAESRGFEIEVQADVCDYLTLFGSFGYTDAEFDEYVDPFGVDVSGNTLAFAPETTWSVGAQFSGKVAEKGRWFARASFVGVGTYYYDAGNREDESYELLDLRVGIEFPHWRLEAWMRNALDEEYVLVAFQPSPADPTFFVGENGAPRTYGVALTITFLGRVTAHLRIALARPSVPG